jgi:hypothetical protein
MIEAKDPNGDWFVALHYKNVLLACDRRDGLSRDYPNETYRVVKLVLGDPEP